MKFGLLFILLFVEVAFSKGTDCGVNSLGMNFVCIPAGSFVMGTSQPPESLHHVIISKNFEMQTTEVTQEQWVAIMGSNPSFYNGSRNPVERVSWQDAQLFIEKLNRQNDGYNYRLPTEAEWEYAVRAGTQTAYFWSDEVFQIKRYGNYFNPNGTIEVGKKEPNPWGLYDTCGNVDEWVQDTYQSDLTTTSEIDPLVTGGKYHVFRGASWASNDYACMSGFRFAETENEYPMRRGHLGVRLVRTKF